MLSIRFQILASAALLSAALGGSYPAFAQTEPTTPPAIVPPAAPPALPPALPVAPPPLPAVPSISVFVAQNGAPTGPFDATQLTELARTGALAAGTMVWQEGMADWAAASTVDALKTILADTTVTLDPMQYLQGTWVSAPTSVPMEGIGNGIGNMVVNYEASGAVSGYGTINVESAYGPMQLTVTVQGTYTAQMSGTDAIIVTPNVQITVSMPGQVPNVEPDKTPQRLTILSPNTLRDDEGVIYTKQ